MKEYFFQTILVALGSMTLLQLSPIRIDPWSWLARKIGRAVTGEVIDRMEKLEKTVEAIRDVSDERAAKATRVRILRFGDEILHGIRHSKEHFDQILLDVTEYEQYCKEHPEFVNNMTVLTTRHIKETYSACFEQHDFL